MCRWRSKLVSKGVKIPECVVVPPLRNFFMGCHEEGIL